MNKRGTDYHIQIMNLPTGKEMPETNPGRGLYKAGHRDARHAAVEIVLGLEAERDDLLEALGVLLNLHDEEVYVKEPWDRAMEYARAALAKAYGEPNE